MSAPAEAEAREVAPLPMDDAELGTTMEHDESPIDADAPPEDGMATRSLEELTDSDAEAEASADASAEAYGEAYGDVDAELDALLAAGDQLALPTDGACSDEELTMDPLDFDEWSEARLHPSDAALLRQAVHANGSVSTYADAEARAPRFERARAVKAVSELKAQFAEAEAAEATAQRAEERAKERSAALLEERRDVAARLEGDGTHKSNLVQLHQLQRTLASVSEEERVQKEISREKTAAARAAELRTDKLRLDLKRAEERAQQLAAPEPSEKRMYELAAHRRVKAEQRAAEQQVARQAEARERHEEVMESRRQVAEAQLRAAREGHRGAVARLRNTLEAQRTKAPELNATIAARLEERAKAVIQLKDSTEAAAAKLRSSNARREERRQKVLEAREEEKQAILARGGNPYHVFRQRDEEARLEKEAKQLKETLSANMQQLQTRMLRQNKEAAEKRAEEAASRALVEQKAKSITAVGKEQKNEEFMRKVTKTGTSLLDPTSQHAHLHASEHMTAKDWKFGLGLGKDPDVIDKMAEQYPDVARECAKGIKPPPPPAVPIASRAHLGEYLPGPKSETVRSIVAEARDHGEAVDEVIEADLVGLWEGPGGVSAPAKAEAKAAVKGMRELSVLEKKYMAQARERQRENIVVKQVVGGKTWTGPAFLCKPEVLEFRDFVVGELYKLTFTLTNVSYSFNSFKPLPFAEAYKSFFELTHTPPGRMSAGTTCTLSLVFTPKLNQPINTELQLLTATGPMSIPLVCSIRTAEVSLSATSLDFGTVVMGESRTLSLAITNDGALHCPYTINQLHTTQPSKEGEPEADPAHLFGFVASGVLEPYSTTQVKFTFRPAMEGEAASLLQLDMGDIAPEREVSLHGLGAEVPIYVERNVVDFRCCTFDGLFRDELVVGNRSKLSFKIQMRVPKELRGNLEFIPSEGYVQGRSTLAVSLKLNTDTDLLDRCKNYLVDGEENVLSVPMRVHVPDQVLPVDFTVRMQLTTSDLVFSHAGEPVTTLDFGVCPLSASRSLSVSIFNPSALPQRFGFSPLPQNIDVQPGDALGTVLPGETVEREVIFSPDVAKSYSIPLVCYTTLKRSFKIVCVGQGVLPPLRLSHTTVLMPVTAEGDKSESEITLTNISKAVQTFNFAPPKNTGLQTFPNAGMLQPGQQIRVLVEFAAPMRTHGEDVEKAHLGDGEASKAVGDATEQDSGQTESTLAKVPLPAPDSQENIEEGRESELVAKQTVAEPWSVHAKSVIPCYVKTVDAEFSPQDTLFLGVETTIVEAGIVFDNGLLRHELHFASVAVGETAMLPLLVRSKSSTPLPLTCEVLDLTGPFSLLNALPTLPPYGSSEIVVRFTPKEQLRSVENLVIRAAGVTLRATIAGQGVSPSLKLNGPTGDLPIVSLGGGASAALLQMNDVLVGDVTTSTVEVINTSEFATRYTLVPLRSGHANHGCVPPFDLSPVEADVPAGGKQILTARFSATHASDSFFQLLEVSVPNQQGSKTLMLRGRAWPCAGYVLSPQQQLRTPERLLNVAQQDMLNLPSASTGLADASLPMEIELIPSRDTNTASAVITIGHIKGTNMSSGKPSALEFVFEGLTDEVTKRGFNVDLPKGTVEAGASKQVTLSFTLRPESMQNTELGIIASFGVSQWAEASLKLVLKGGNPLPSKPETQIIVKGFIASSRD